MRLIAHILCAAAICGHVPAVAQAPGTGSPAGEPRIVQRVVTVPANGEQEAADGAQEPRVVRRVAAPPPPQRSGERADVAIELIAGVPVVTATVNGQGPYRFIVDTGAAGYLVVSPALAQSLGLQQIGEAMSGDPSGTNLMRVPLYRAETFALGGLTFSGVMTTALSIPNPRLAALDGIIGIRFFQDLLLEIDYGRLRLTAAAGALPVANDREIVDVTLDRGVLVTLPLRVGETVHDVHLDTGNSRFPFFMPSGAIAALPTRGSARGIGTARTVSQEIALEAIDLAAPVSVGATRLPAVTAVGYPAVAPVGNIGSLALANMTLTVDYANRRVRIVPSAR